jgi:hypothetical protein
MSELPVKGFLEFISFRKFGLNIKTVNTSSCEVTGAKTSSKLLSRWISVHTQPGFLSHQSLSFELSSVGHEGS